MAPAPRGPRLRRAGGCGHRAVESLRRAARGPPLQSPGDGEDIPACTATTTKRMHEQQTRLPLPAPPLRGKNEKKKKKKPSPRQPSPPTSPTNSSSSSSSGGGRLGLWLGFPAVLGSLVRSLQFLRLSKPLSREMLETGFQKRVAFFTPTNTPACRLVLPILLLSRRKGRAAAAAIHTYINTLVRSS